MKTTNIHGAGGPGRHYAFGKKTNIDVKANSKIFFTFRP